MAGVSKQKKGRLNNLSFDIVFEGALLSTTRAALVVELIKYILYERQQVPMTVDQLKKEGGVVHSSASASLPANANSTTNWHLISTENRQGMQELEEGIQPSTQKESVFNRAQHKKAKQAVDNLLQLFLQIEQAFESCSEIDQVVVMLGGTVVSPKESYIVKLPPLCPDADSLSLKACKQTLFKQIVGEDVLGQHSSNLSPTTMMLLMSVPRSIPLEWFLPKQSLKMPKTGLTTTFNFHCTYVVPICHDLTFMEGNVSNLSGFEALECSVCGGVEEGDNSPLVPPETTDSGSRTCSETGELSANNGKCPFTPLPSSDRFCKHQKLKYVYTQRKGRSVSSSSVDSELMASEDNNDSPIRSVSHYQDNHDCIWYQSPVSFKGFALKQ